VLTARPGTNTVRVVQRYPADIVDGVEIRELRCFVAVAEELHFGRAAERLGIAQPPLSRTITLLERRLGVALLERTSRKVTLTDAGAVLLADARAILGALAAGLFAQTRNAPWLPSAAVGALSAAVAAKVGHDMRAQLSHHAPDPAIAVVEDGLALGLAAAAYR